MCVALDARELCRLMPAAGLATATVANRSRYIAKLMLSGPVSTYLCVYFDVQCRADVDYIEKLIDYWVIIWNLVKNWQAKKKWNERCGEAGKTWFYARIHQQTYMQHSCQSRYQILKHCVIEQGFWIFPFFMRNCLFLSSYVSAIEAVWFVSDGPILNRKYWHKWDTDTRKPPHSECRHLYRHV